MACASTALMIGGGIAGLATAIALSRVGVACDVIEKAQTPMGASLGLSGRSADALVELGVYDECYETGSPWTDGRTASTIYDSAGNFVNAGPKRPTWPGAKTSIGVYRPTLLRILEDTARGLGVKFERGVTVDTIDDRSEACFVTFSNGEERSYDLIVGADGIGSHTRRQIFPDAPTPAYSGQMSIRWMAPGPAIQPEGWYLGPVGRLGFYYLPQGYIYVPAVISAPEWVRLTGDELYALYTRLLDSYTAPAIVELRSRLTRDADLICRPFEWLLLSKPWYRGRTILIGDAAHATTAHMGMGGGMALEDAVVLAQCIAQAPTLHDAFATFMTRRIARVRTVVETSVSLSRLEQEKAPPAANRELLSSALNALALPY